MKFISSTQTTSQSKCPK